MQQHTLELYQSWIVEAQNTGESKQAFDAYFLAQYIDAQITSLVIRMNLKEDPLMLRRQGQLSLSVLYT
jgi:hypothetical protein